MEPSCKYAIIVGAASEIGMAVATSLAKQPLCQSILLGDSQSSSQILEQVGKVVASTCAGVRVEFDTFDATNESEVASFFSRATEKLGGHSEVLVNVTSYIDTSLDAASFNATPIPNFDKSYELNQKSAFLIQRCFLRHLLRTSLPKDQTGSNDGSDCGHKDSRGSIVHIVPYASEYSLTSSNNPILAATSNAIVGMCKTDAFDYAPDGIRINCVAAADVLLTPLPLKQPQRQDQASATILEDQNHGHAIFLLGRHGTSQDVGNLVEFLSSPKASWLTGLVIPVDGGQHLARF